MQLELDDRRTSELLLHLLSQRLNQEAPLLGVAVLATQQWDVNVRQRIAQ